jgi:serine/threonine protein phosphatase 1
MSRVFAIGDIHGCFFTFKKLLLDICRVKKDDDVYLLGDYVDRGPRSKELIDYIISLIEDGYRIFPIIGNHEQLLLEAVDSVTAMEIWNKNGNAETLKSFGLDHPSKLEKKYIDFFHSLRYYVLLDDFVLVHGGVDFELPNPLSDLYSMVWIRNTYVDTKKIGGRRLIVGHTPRSLDMIAESIDSDRILLDGGCVYLHKFPNYGYLCALELNSMELFYQQNIDF